MPLATDAEMLLYYGLDESQPKATRDNSGSLGADHDLAPSQSSGTDGIPTVADGNGGRALDIFVSRTGYTTAQRGLKGTAFTGSLHPARKTVPTGSASDDFAYGCRLQFKGLNAAGGATEPEAVFLLVDWTAAAFCWSILLLPDSASTPTAAQIRLRMGDVNVDVSATGYTVTGSPPTNYIVKDEWYRIVVRWYYSGTGARVKVYIVRESTGTLYTFDRNANITAPSYSGFDASTDCRVWVGEHQQSAYFPLGGYLDECWFYGAPVTDEEATSIVYGGFTIPWVAPSYRVADHVVHAAVTKEGAAYPKTRALPTGGLAVRFPPQVLAHRPRVRVEGWRPGRPWLLRSVEGRMNTSGPYDGRMGLRWALEDITRGLYRAGGQLPSGAWEDARNVETSPLGVRRRRGFQIRRSVDPDQGDTAINAATRFRRSDGSLYGLYKVGVKLYEETGDDALEIDSGWNPQQLPSFAFLNDRLLILSGQRRKTWRGQTGGVDSFGVVAPASLSAALVGGGSLNGTFYYAVTEYDPVTGDESEPVVLASAISPSTQTVRLTIGAVSSDARFTQRRIYRTTNGGSPPNLFLIDTITAATTYDDTGEPDGVDLVGQVQDADGNLLAYLTGDPPDSFSFAVVHMERCFYSGGEDFPDRVYVGEANALQRWYSDFYIQAESTVRALASWGHRLVIFTDYTVEIVESDWVRDANGDVNWQRTVVSRTVGASGHAAVTVAEGDLFWKDRRGFWTLAGSEPRPLSAPIRDLWPYINHALSNRACLSYNHLRRQLWLSVPHANLQEDSSRFQTVLALDLDALQAGQIKWMLYEIEATHHGPFDDDLNGLQYGVIDHLGVFKQMETFEGDGAEGDEGFTTEDEGGDTGSVGIEAISGSTVTVHGTPGWTTDALRGMAVVFRDRSTGLLYWHPVVGNGADTLEVAGTPNAALAERDGWYLGGIRAYVQFAEQGHGSPNAKVVEQIQMEFADLTQSSLYL